jgi:4-carboxymuconolactone decarboxylase
MPDLPADAMNERHARGLAALGQLDEQAAQSAGEWMAPLDPTLSPTFISFSYGDIYTRPGLEPTERQMLTIAILIAQGGCERQLKAHAQYALNAGVSPVKIREIVVHSMVFVGIARMMNAMRVVKELFAENGLLPLDTESGG